MSELIVVGNGMVGQRFVEALRARDTGGRWRVTVLAEERRPAYDRVRAHPRRRSGPAPG